MTRILRAQHLKKSYKKRVVIRDVSLQLQQKQVAGVLGPNGSGKTTCFYMIMGLIRPDDGKVYIDDQDITCLPIHQRAREGLGYLPQEASVFRKLSVADNIMAILELRKDLSRKERQQKQEQLISEFHLQAIAASKGISLSGGERRRVEIARALASDPDFILLDEPFAGVDPISIHDIKQMITYLKERGLGVLITDHNVRETLSICDHAYIIGNGCVIAEGANEAIVQNTQVREVYLGQDFKL